MCMSAPQPPSMRTSAGEEGGDQAPAKEEMRCLGYPPYVFLLLFLIF